jgi:hypothetical protein
MGYARSIEAFQRAKSYLDTIKNSKAPVVWTSLDAKRLQYLIHNGLYVATLLRIPGYAELRDQWKIRYKGKHVTATPMVSELEVEIEYTECNDPFIIVEKLIELKESKQTAKFLDIDLPQNELDLVFNWCNQENKIARLDGTTLIITEKTHA